MTIPSWPSAKADCVPVSITEASLSVTEIDKRLDHQNRVLLRRIIGKLVHDHGWTLGQDGNLYSPTPALTGWGERVS